jgi:hypothetical protein
MDSITSWLTSARDWLDARGRPAWLAAMIIGFIFFWPVGLAILFYMIGSKRMKCNRKYNIIPHRRMQMSSSGNVAFDNYRDETLKRLEEEQTAFQGFLQRLREAKDKAEFDQFMNDRRDKTQMTPEFG